MTFEFCGANVKVKPLAKTPTEYVVWFENKWKRVFVTKARTTFIEVGKAWIEVNLNTDHALQVEAEKNREYSEGESVEVYDLGSRGGVWVKGTVLEDNGGVRVDVRIRNEGSGILFLRHNVRKAVNA